MHRSRLHGFMIDCQTEDVNQASHFWRDALGMKVTPEDDRYAVLDAEGRDLHIEVQRVDHQSRLHLDIETDDQEAEVARLEKLGAKKLVQTHSKTWIVMEAPTGQRFCVVRTRHDLSKAAGVTVWP